MINYKGIIDAVIFISLLLCGLVIVDLVDHYL